MSRAWDPPVALIRERELAEWLGLSPFTLTRMRRDGTGPPFVRIGHSVRYVVADVEEWLRNGGTP